MFRHFIRERPFDFYGAGAGRYFEKNNQESDKDKQNRQDDQANKKYPGRCEKRRARKCQKTNGHKLTIDK